MFKAGKPLQQKKTKPTMEFPSWRAIILDLIRYHDKKRKTKFSITSQEIDRRLEQLEEAKRMIDHFHPSQIIASLSKAAGEYLPKDSLEALIEKFRHTCIAPNQFYTVYDMNLGWHTHFDPKIMDLLGITPEEFSLQAMAGLDPNNKLYHPDDVNHMIRWAAVGYVLLSFPGFRWSTLTDYYWVSFRVGTDKSRLTDINKNEYVTLEKKCYPVMDKGDGSEPRPMYHLDQWAVQDASFFDYLKPRWITTQDQSVVMNAFVYLMNAYLLDISPKHIAMLHERQNFDRNKAIATSMQEKIRKGSNLEVELEETHVANTFAKTIRSKVAEVMNVWDKRKPDNRVEVDSDQQAVHYARVLGLLPVPEIVLDIIYSSVISNEA